VVVAHHGDVAARAAVRRDEIAQSGAFVAEAIAALPPGELRAAPAALGRDAVAVALVEGWRGEVCHVAVTDGGGRLRAYKVVDPSFHNWHGLGLAMRGGEISDFPLVNKSFNLSYCGHDL
jgi:Ni,Fe-hydrogenase III large subunit